MSPPTSTAGSTGSSTAARRARGVESTIVACLGGRPRLLRPGALTRERIEAALGVALDERRRPAARRSRPASSRRTTRRAPGSGSARARCADDEAALDFGGALAQSGATARLDLSPAGDLDEAAAHLFAYLRALDDSGRGAHRRRADPRARARRRDQRPAAPRRRAARGRRLTPRPHVAAAAAFVFLHVRLAPAHTVRSFRLRRKRRYDPWPPHSTGMNSV